MAAPPCPAELVDSQNLLTLGDLPTTYSPPLAMWTNVVFRGVQFALSWCMGRLLHVRLVEGCPGLAPAGATTPAAARDPAKLVLATRTSQMTLPVSRGQVPVGW